MMFPCLKKIFFFFMLSGKFVNATDKPTDNVTLSHEDLKYFLNSIDYTVMYIENNTPVLRELGALNLVFGLFISNVNLKSAIINNHIVVPQRIRVRINEISQRIDELLHQFDSTSAVFLSQGKRLIRRLFVNSTRWSNQMLRFHRQHKSLPTAEDIPVQFESMYRDYKTYSSAVKDRDEWDPTPHKSDECLMALSVYEYKIMKKNLKVCELPIVCENYLKTGTDFGYALSHRILLLFIANLGMGCSLLGKLQDYELNVELCQEAYFEVQFIALNGYEFIDLMLEYVVICSMLGHAEFLRHDWLEETVSRQIPRGCFESPFTAEPEDPCDMHLTAGSVAALCSAVRWILENVHSPKIALFNNGETLALPFLRRFSDKNSSHDRDNKMLGQRYFI